MTPAEKLLRSLVNAIDEADTVDPHISQAVGVARRWCFHSDDANRRKRATRLRRSEDRRAAERNEESEAEARWFAIKVAVQALSKGRCEVCNGEGSDPHHLLMGAERDARTAADVVDLCRACHRAYHRHEWEVMECIKNLARISREARRAVERRMSKVERIRSEVSRG